MVRADNKLPILHCIVKGVSKLKRNFRTFERCYLGANQMYFTA